MELTPERKAEIDAMTHEQLARCWSSLPPEDEFWSGESGNYALRRLIQLGGMTKDIGWDLNES
jgi:hypothetical protein